MAKVTVSKDEVTRLMQDMLDCVSESDREILARNLEIKSYKKNEVIYHEGEQPDMLLCLIQGKVKVYKEGVGGRAQIMRVMKPVEYFGYRAYFSKQHFITAAAAFESSVVAMLPLHLIEGMIQQNAQLAWFFIRRLSEALGVADERTVNLTQKHIRGRLAESILFLKESYGVEEDGCTLSIYLSREDMANLSNMTTSNAIRTLSGFANEKLVAIDGRKIKIINERELERISKIG